MFLKLSYEHFKFPSLRGERTWNIQVLIAFAKPNQSFNENQINLKWLFDYIVWELWRLFGQSRHRGW